MNEDLPRRYLLYKNREWPGHCCVATGVKALPVKRSPDGH
jgi:hypothetical protein